MVKRTEFEASAQREFDEAFRWYAERSTGAALGFASEIDAAIEKIAADPERFAITFSGCQICSLKRYPYGVVFYREPERIVIVAIAHSSRRPGYWEDRL